ncbi:MAG: penicillin-binding protein 2 [Porticoccaceae bacterium]|jgi:penicillin-binding protein 2|nr:penicillin-binding protein 2 [Porticoccaceae bacterium]
MINDAAFSDPARDRRIFTGRLLIAGLAAIVLTSIVLYRYFDLQVTRHQDFATHSDNNRVHVRPAAPSRGLIYDRNGELLADNRPSYSLSIIRERSEDLEQLLLQISSLIDISSDDIERFEKRLKRRKPYEHTPLRFNLSEQERGILAVNSYRLDGAEVTARLTRFYPNGELFAHVIGYVGRINERESQQIDSVAYSGTDSIGKIGLEKYYEDRLLGAVGTEHVETNARGRVMRILENVSPLPGTNLTVHLDSNLQRVAHKAFKDDRGALVAIDIKTGGILSMVSAPSYDPNLFVSGISQTNYDQLLQSSDRPLFDRAIRGQYPPGSTIKPLFGLIGLHNNSISMDYSIEDPGYFFMEGIERPWRDHNSKRGGHGKGVDLAKAIIESCDVFFYKMSVKTGIDLLSSYSEMFGLGNLTGIDMPGERPGIMPSREWKQGAKQEAWFNGDTINVSIGQGFMLTTPLQLAVMSARIASKGKLLKPQLVKSIDGVATQPVEVRESINMSDEYWDYVHKAMRDVVHSPRGTAKGISNGLNYEIAGKTGTAQVISISAEDEYDSSKIDKSQWDHALFVAFAPMDDPQIAVGLIVENGEHGSSAAAPIARLVIDEYMKSKSKQSQIIANN